MKLIYAIVLLPLVTLVVAHLGKDFLNKYLPSSTRIILAIKNFFTCKSRYLEDSFRVVLCWLEDDRDGDSTKIVANAFTTVRGFTLVRSDRIVKAFGTADQWEEAMRKSTQAVLVEWNADLALVGTVRKTKEVLSLWFVPRTGDGTLARGHNQPYILVNVTLDKDFHLDLSSQITAVAFAAVAPLADTEVRGQVLNEGLREATNNLRVLLTKHTFDKPEQRARLQWSLGNALCALGERESGTARLEEAVTAYRAALEERTRERVPLDWAATQNNLGNAFLALGKRESRTAHLEEAVTAYRAALEERTRERVPFDWAATQNNLGSALCALGERESGTARLEEAVTAYRAALYEYTRERVPLDWATTQNNLGNALWALGERESGTARLEEAVTTYRAALEERTRERVPLDWAATQNNLGNALWALGKRESGTARLEEAVTAYRTALEERTRERVPLDWAATQNNLGNALWALGERENGTARLEEAVTAYRAALDEFSCEGMQFQRDIVQNQLDGCLKRIRELNRPGIPGAVQLRFWIDSLTKVLLYL